MPNWCNNTLIVKGNRDKLNIFIDAASNIDDDIDESEKSQLSLSKLYPEPDYSTIKVEPALKINEVSSESSPDWWNWRISHWGCKWDINAELYDYDSELEYKFMSPWSPPIEAFEKISVDFPNLEFILQYDEPGVGFGGRIVIKNGEYISNNQWDL